MALNPDDLDGLPRLRQDMIIAEWEEIDGHRVPSVGYVIVGGSTPDGVTPPDGRWHYSVYRYRRTELKFLDEIPAERFAPELNAGDFVIDHRIGLRFRVGSTVLELDGVEYDVGEPINAHPGDRLPELLENARPTGRIPVSSASASFDATATATAGPIECMGGHKFRLLPSHRSLLIDVRDSPRPLLWLEAGRCG